MKLLRLAILRFDPEPKDLSPRALNVGEVKVKVEVVQSPDLEKVHFLAHAQINLTQRPEVTSDGFLLVPEEARKKAEAGIESVANIIAVTENCKRRISSPTPCVALLPETPESLTWLNSTRGILVAPSGYPNPRFHVTLDETAQQSLQDRLDGVALLAEALSHDHPTGKFHEFMRFFECAFARSPSQFKKKLSQFLKEGPFGYNREEIKRWIELRNPATHADKTETSFVLESDTRPVVARMEQAAYDVLFNKVKWHDPSRERREVWTPAVATTSDIANFYMTTGKELDMQIRLLDDFSAYSRALMSIGLRDGWWAKTSNEEQVTSGSVQVKQPS